MCPRRVPVCDLMVKTEQEEFHQKVADLMVG